MSRIAFGLLACLMSASCSTPEYPSSRTLDDAVRDPRNEREDIPKLVDDARARLMEPYLLGGEDVSALYIRTQIAFFQNSDSKLLKQLKATGSQAGYLYYFLEDSKPEINSRRRSVAYIESHKPPESQLPALNVEE